MHINIKFIDLLDCVSREQDELLAIGQRGKNQKSALTAAGTACSLVH